MDDVLKNGYHEPLLDYNNADWFVDEIINLEKKMAFFFGNTNKDIIMTETKEEDCENNIICRICEKENISDKIKDYCHLTGKDKGPALNTCNINVTQKQSNFIPFIFHNFSNDDCRPLYKKLIDKKNDKVKFDILPKKNEEYISVTYGCIRFIDNYQILSSRLDSLVKTIVDNSHKTFENLKKEFVDNDEILNIVNEIGEENRTFEILKRIIQIKMKN